jgi:hypothetical protein
MPASANTPLTPAQPYTLALRADGVAKLKRRAKVTADRDFAAVIGFDQGQMSRVLAGKSAPGPRFIAGAVQAFGWHALKDLFIVVPVDASERQR